MKFKMTKQEKHWVLYDVGNSAFALMVSTIMPIYFYYLALRLLFKAEWLNKAFDFNC